jgi:hypothetical protein
VEDILRNWLQAFACKCNLYRCSAGVSKAWRDRACGALARLRALPPGQSRHLRRAAPRVAERVLRFFAAHCTSLRDVTVVGLYKLNSVDP